MRTLTLLSALLFVFVVSAEMSSAKMSVVQMPQIPMPKVLSSFKTAEANRKLTSEEIEAYQLAQLAESAFKVDSVMSREPIDEKRVLSSKSIVESIRTVLRGESNWQTPNAKELISKNPKLLKKALSAESYEWATVLILLGDQVAAKNILKDIFSKEYERVMSLKKAIYGLGGSPMRDAEQIHKTLSSITNGSEQTELNEKLRKMKIHISQLPQFNIKT